MQEDPAMVGPNVTWPMSLLWPGGAAEHASVPLSSAAFTDLAIEHIVRALDTDSRHDRVIRAILGQLCTDPAVIRYRQDILADLLESPELSGALAALLPELQTLMAPGGANWPGESPLGTVVARLRELDQYVHCIDRLSAVLEQAPTIRSAGLCKLRAAMAHLAVDPDVVALRAELPALHDLIGEASSVTIGVNLGRDLQPESATIVELNRFQFKGQRSMLGRLLPGGANDGPTGITPLMNAGTTAIRRDSQLFKDLQRLLESVATPLVKALARYREVNARPLAALEGELAFWTGAVGLILRMQHAGIAMCRPDIAPADERAFAVTDLANITLALQMLPRPHWNGEEATDVRLGDRLVTNDAVFEPGTRTLIVTGPNRGGKTTFCRSIGQAQVMFQCGLHVAGSAARLSPVDGIWTHFPLPEVDRPGAGRLDEEIQRLRDIFVEATGASLILLNEPLTSTSERDALHIAVDIVRALQAMGARVVLITHLHDLALKIPDLNAQCPPGRGITSLVAQTVTAGDAVRGTFRIVPGVSTGQSYAVEIARQHGLTFDQLTSLLEERGTAEADTLPARDDVGEG